MKTRNLYDEAVTKTASCIIAMSNPARGAVGIEASLAEFEQAVRVKIAQTLMAAMEEMKDLPIEELRKIAQDN